MYLVLPSSQNEEGFGYTRRKMKGMSAPWYIIPPGIYEIGYHYPERVYNKGFRREQIIQTGSRHAMILTSRILSLPLAFAPSGRP